MSAPLNPGDSRVEMTQIVLPSFTNSLGNVFGGQIAAWSDICAAVAAQRFCRRQVVTASMDELHFLVPVRQGMVVVLQAQVNQAWNTSMEVGVRIEAEDPLTGTKVHCSTAFFTFVALDAQGTPTTVPSLEVSGQPEWQRRASDAQDRRDTRLQVRAARAARRGRS